MWKESPHNRRNRSVSEPRSNSQEAMMGGGIRDTLPWWTCCQRGGRLKS
jgi:hypothetical protein